MKFAFRRTPARFLSSFRPSTRWRVATLIAAVLSLVLVLLYIDRYPTISPVDEFHHIDYAAHISEGGLLGRGDKFGETMMHEFSCRRLDASQIKFEVPPCNAPPSAMTPDKYPESGYNSAYIHPPTYYMLAAGGGLLAESFDLSFVTGARLANVFWVLLFVGLMMTAGRWLRRSPWVTAVATVVCAANPGSLHALATVNPDAAGLACGAMTLVGYLGRRRSGRLWWLLLVIAPVAVKSTHGLASAAALGLVAIDCWLERTRGPQVPLRRRLDDARPLLAGGVGLVGLAGAVLVLQRLVAADSLAVIDQLTRFHADRFPIRDVLANIIVVPPLQGYLPFALNVDSVITAVTILTVMVLLGAVVGLANRRDPDDQMVRNIGVAALVTSICAGPALILLNYGLNEIYVVIPDRYLISLIPWIVVVAAAAFDRTWVTRWMLTLAAGFMWFVLADVMWQATTIGVNR